MASYKRDEWGMTAQQRMCADAYRISRLAWKAYKEAYPRCSEATARTSGPELLRKPHIQAYIKHLDDTASKKLANKYEVTQERLIQEMSYLAFSNAQDLYDAKGKPRKIQDLPESLARAIESFDAYGQIKLHSKKAPIETLMRTEGMFEKDNMHNQQVIVINTSLPNKQLGAGK